jgi:hypothetical protein
MRLGSNASVDVAIDHQSEDDGSVAMGFRQICEGKEKMPVMPAEEESSSRKIS